jgi:hypothetical protein
MGCLANGMHMQVRNGPMKETSNSVLHDGMTTSPLLKNACVT